MQVLVRETDPLSMPERIGGSSDPTIDGGPLGGGEPLENRKDQFLLQRERLGHMKKSLVNMKISIWKVQNVCNYRRIYTNM